MTERRCGACGGPWTAEMWDAETLVAMYLGDADAEALAGILARATWIVRGRRGAMAPTRPTGTCAACGTGLLARVGLEALKASAPEAGHAHGRRGESG